MKENRIEIETPSGRLVFVSIGENEVMLTEYHGKDRSITVPEAVKGKRVTVIGKKVFLSCKEIQEIILPDSIEEIGDWAFACCSQLTTLSLPRKILLMGQGILKDCFHLEKICLPEEKNADTAYLLAATMNKLEAFYLFDLQEAGKREWFKKWDSRMLFLMEQSDTEGFSKMLLCGEEDYGSRENNLDYYMEQKRKEKVRLAMLRLLHDCYLEEEHRQKLCTYLQAHKKGEQTEETWQVVLEEHGDEKDYYQFLIDLDCITMDNFSTMLEDMGDYHTEMKAFLMHYQNTRLEKEDSFAALSFEL